MAPRSWLPRWRATEVEVDRNRAPNANLLGLLKYIQPQPSELSRATGHAQTVRNRLTGNFDIRKFARIGSHQRGTAIRHYSDLDFIAVLARKEARWGRSTVASTTVLNRVRDDLIDRYTTTDIGRDKQAIVIGFSGGQSAMDVVPALFDSFSAGRPIYVIPDAVGGWRETSPESHDRYFASADERSVSKLRRTVQLLKWWKHSRTPTVPISSFYMEVVLASQGTCVGVMSYSQCLYQAFRTLSVRAGQGIRDPLGISGVIAAADTAAKLDSLRRALSYAEEHAARAFDQERLGSGSRANDQWNMVFNDSF